MSCRDRGGGETYALCPECLRRLPARRVHRDGSVFLERECPEHGSRSDIIWRGYVNWDDWILGAERSGDWNADCPNACGLCPSHLRDSCCVLFEVTPRCDLDRCEYCFAGGGRGERDPSLEELTGRMKSFVRPGETFIQLSGGEPCVRDDLPDVVRAAVELGCGYVQLNTNGLRLALDEKFAAALAEAGLSFVFMQFDGLDDSIYRRLRGRDMFGIKKRAIENCAKHKIGVTLVPTLVRGVNTDAVGDMARFAVSLSPAVRGVHFQPACLTGRHPDEGRSEERFTLDELVFELRRQAGDLIGDAVILPSSCDHPLCGFHSDFVTLEDGSLYPLSGARGKRDDGCCGAKDKAGGNREFIGKRWKIRETKRSCSCRDITDLDYFASRSVSHAFTLTAMAFQDRWNLDLERLRSCSLHVFNDGRTVPFCANYLRKRGRG
jgi:uncharacterized radical SAM superfamily Fe-S cluster-containing enzyme